MTDTDELRIVPLAEGDIAAVIELAGVIWRSHYPGIISMEQIDYMLGQRYTPAVIRAQLHSGSAWWDLAFVGARLLGFAQYELHGNAMKLDKLYLHPDVQRLGYGGRMLAHIEDQARRRGAGAVRLNVNKHNLKSIAAYRKHGYEVIEEVVADIGAGYVMDDYVMEKKL
ncbi:MAG: GNAT family N-acetyltransferase [Burkholderiales bacterium]|nr:GNAT family N-acetyltransferase [Burkholderiales bacterium]